jgi:hypothetical protein
VLLTISRHSPNDDVKTPDDSNAEKGCACNSESPIFHFLIHVCQTAPAAMIRPATHRIGLAAEATQPKTLKAPLQGIKSLYKPFSVLVYAIYLGFDFNEPIVDLLMGDFVFHD